MNDESQLRDLASRYTAAWCSQNPARVAQFFAPDASLTINDGAPAIGRAAIERAACEFTRDRRRSLPNCGSFLSRGAKESSFIQHSTVTIPARVAPESARVWPVLKNGKIGRAGLIANSQVHVDTNDYHRQIEHGPDGAGGSAGVVLLN